MNSLFVELLQVALGNRNRLSRCPSQSEWEQLYKIAEHQTLIGICFYAIQYINKFDCSSLSNLPKDLYLKWMGFSAIIQHNNESLNQQCVSIQTQLNAADFKNCILKGQSIIHYYDNGLASLRQCGDIDVWCCNSSIKQLVEYVKSNGFNFDVKHAHVSSKLGGIAKVELHPIPLEFRCPFYNYRLKKWFEKNSNSTMYDATGILTMSKEFNIVYLLAHMFHHVLYEGIGLRQFVDYYFLLKSIQDNQKREKAIIEIEALGMGKFMRAVMYIMNQWFLLDDSLLLCPGNFQYGSLLFYEIMQGGNFGHYDERYNSIQSRNALLSAMMRMKKKFVYFKMAPFEVLCSPLWSLWQMCWRKFHGYC